jgi:hypothetical protein
MSTLDSLRQAETAIRGVENAFGFGDLGQTARTLRDAEQAVTIPDEMRRTLDAAAEVQPMVSFLDDLPNVGPATPLVAPLRKDHAAEAVKHAAEEAGQRAEAREARQRAEAEEARCRAEAEEAGQREAMKREARRYWAMFAVTMAGSIVVPFLVALLLHH